MQVVGRAETQHAALVLGHAIDPAACRPVEGPFVAVTEEKVLPEVFAELLEKVAQAADQRKVAQDRVLLLRDVLEVEIQDQDGEGKCEQDTETDREDAEHERHTSSARIDRTFT